MWHKYCHTYPHDWLLRR